MAHQQIPLHPVRLTLRSCCWKRACLADVARSPLSQKWNVALICSIYLTCIRTRVCTGETLYTSAVGVEYCDDCLCFQMEWLGDGVCYRVHLLGCTLSWSCEKLEPWLNIRRIPITGLPSFAYIIILIDFLVQRRGKWLRERWLMERWQLPDRERAGQSDMGCKTKPHSIFCLWLSSQILLR